MLLPERRQGDLETEAAVGLGHVSTLRIGMGHIVPGPGNPRRDMMSLHRIKTNRAVAEMAGHLKFETIVTTDKIDRTQGKLCLQGSVIVIGPDIETENGLNGMFPDKTLKVSQGSNQPQLRINGESLVGKNIGGFQGDSSRIIGKLAYRNLALDIQVPGTPEPLGQ